ncbi:hypothetical protein [Deinococcus peraridilitoris]|uniref:Uncharacterized protein n=1 Tax=Deinococcus peraridilitoris (strain DSM 19664 / LMG 22246 / CIP 109416 / KR-200) TaxID=937777 RepID=K9ZWX0_DEIPD|nr:hypothetical protein [Deinococcus peraridilitoris]AFZ66071.1 hypothetical protein Deipe_0475 [Deinococcus peraridilitoris DSM 19664]
MATTLTKQPSSVTGLNPAYTAADATGVNIPNDGRTALHVKNASAGAITVTMRATTNYFDGVKRDIQIAIPAGGERLIKPAEANYFADGSGLTLFDFSAVASVTVAALSL